MVKPGDADGGASGDAATLQFRELDMMCTWNFLAPADGVGPLPCMWASAGAAVYSPRTGKTRPRRQASENTSSLPP